MAGFRRARQFVRKTVTSMGPLDQKRILLNNLTIPAITATAYDNPLRVDFLIGQETVDEQVESDGTSIAQVRPYSKIVAMRGRFGITGAAASNVYRYIIVKNVDNDFATADIMGTFHTSDDNATSREIRQNTIKKGMLYGNATSGNTFFSITPKRQTLRRLGSIREDDRISMVIAINRADSSELHGFGACWVRHN